MFMIMDQRLDFVFVVRVFIVRVAIMNVVGPV